MLPHNEAGSQPVIESAGKSAHIFNHDRFSPTSPESSSSEADPDLSGREAAEPGWTVAIYNRSDQEGG